MVSPKLSRRFYLLALLLIASLLVISAAQQAAAEPEVDSALLKALKYRLIGPFNGGRVLAVAGIAGDANTYYFGAAAGGVWKTTDGGLNWTPIFNDKPVSSIGAIAVAPSDPNIIYVGTGEACIRGDISHGDGAYKSLDAGKTWKNIGLKDTRHIGKIAVHPRDPNVVLVAALGHAYGPNQERGLFRSKDGGKSWEKVIYKNEKTGAIDVDFDPSNPHIIFAALWEAHRTPWSLSSGGPGSGLYKSSDGGDSWKQLTGNGLPEGILGRIGVSVSPASSNRVYAIIEAKEGGLFRSDDGGESWRLISSDGNLRQRPWYYSHVMADPTDADTVYVLNVRLLKSIDGGRTFAAIQQFHGDNHALWIDPKNSRRMINGNDGGANVTIDGGQSWTPSDLPISQFYHVNVDNRNPYYIYGAMQDDGTCAIPSNSLSPRGITRQDWYPVGGGESGYVVPKPDDANIVYAGSYGGHITRYDHRTRQAQAINPWPENTIGWGAGALKYRFQWTAPIATSPHDPNVVYHAANVLFKTTDGGKSWTIISPDLTRNDKSKQEPSGGPITGDNTSVEYYCTIFTAAESPKQKELIWVGTDDGLVHITRDGGKNWSNVTPKGLPEWSLISMVEPSPHDAATAYVAVDRHELDDFKPYAYKTNDYGKTWTPIVNGIPENTFIRVVREDPERRGLLYAGTETGVYVSFDDGAHWQSLQLNLPTSPVHDLQVKDNDLVVGTHGRSIWILDNLSLLRQLASAAIKDVHLFKPEPALRLRGGLRFRHNTKIGENPPVGAVINYYLKSAPKGEVTITILDAKGQTVRSFSSNGQGEAREREEREEQPGFDPGAREPRVPAEAGMNTFVWDLRYAPAERIPGAILWGGSIAGPLALPGTYQVKLSADGQMLTAPLEVVRDPRISTPAADLEAQFKLLMELRDKLSLAHSAVNRIRDIRKQMTDLRRRIADENKKEGIGAAAKELDKKLAGVEEAIVQTRLRSSQDVLNHPIRLNNKIAALAALIGGSDAAPTSQSYQVAESLAAQLQAELARLNRIIAMDLKAFNQLVRKEDIPPIIAAEVK